MKSRGSSYEKEARIGLVVLAESFTKASCIAGACKPFGSRNV